MHLTSIASTRLGCAALVLGLSIALHGCKEDDEGTGGNGDGTACGCDVPSGTPLEMETAKLYFEFNSTDDDTGIHGLFGGVNWAEMCITAPDGTEFLAGKPGGDLKEFGLSDLFFESREPAASDVSQAEVLARFPAGTWEVAGTTYDGIPFAGSATLTQDLPEPPIITAPADGATIDPADLVVTWDAVTQTVAGDAVTITGYEVIVTNDDKDGDDPHGMSHPILSAHVIPSVTSLTIPSEFLESGTTYELELIAIEESGNQTIAVQFFDTP